MELPKLPAARSMVRCSTSRQAAWRKIWSLRLHLQYLCPSSARAGEIVEHAHYRAAGNFGNAIRELEPDVVIDLICYTLESAQHACRGARGQCPAVSALRHCLGYGPAVEVPVTENQPRRPISDHGVRKAAIENYLLGEYQLSGFPAALFHPGIWWELGGLR